MDFMPPGSYFPGKISRNSAIYCEPIEANIVQMASRKKMSLNYSSEPALEEPSKIAQ